MNDIHSAMSGGPAQGNNRGYRDIRHYDDEAEEESCPPPLQVQASDGEDSHYVIE